MTALVVGSGLAFLAYGVHCLHAESMRAEFARFGIANVRVLTGVLELLGGGGLIVGLWLPPLLLAASAGLALLMLAGVAVRVRIGDSALQIAPAAVLLAVNGWIFADVLRG